MLLLLSTFFLFACNQNKIYEKHQAIDNYSWNRINSSLFFEVPVEDIISKYNISFAIRYIDGVSFNHVEIGVTIYTPVGEEIYNEYIIDIRDNTGSYRGDVAGDIWDLTELIIENTALTQKGTYKFEIENLTGHRFTVPGIMEIGLIVEKAE